MAIYWSVKNVVSYCLHFVVHLKLRNYFSLCFFLVHYCQGDDELIFWLFTETAPEQVIWNDQHDNVAATGGVLSNPLHQRSLHQQSLINAPIMNLFISKRYLIELSQATLRYRYDCFRLILWIQYLALIKKKMFRATWLLFAVFYSRWLSDFHDGHRGPSGCWVFSEHRVSGLFFYSIVAPLSSQSYLYSFSPAWLHAHVLMWVYKAAEIQQQIQKWVASHQTMLCSGIILLFSMWWYHIFENWRESDDLWPIQRTNTQQFFWHEMSDDSSQRN